MSTPGALSGAARFPQAEESVIPIAFVFPGNGVSSGGRLYRRLVPPAQPQTSSPAAGHHIMDGGPGVPMSLLTSLSWLAGFGQFGACAVVCVTVIVPALLIAHAINKIVASQPTIEWRGPKDSGGKIDFPNRAARK